MSDQQRPGYQVDTYVRPNLSYCCGRGGKWGKSCWQGPNGEGQCGGASECSPVKEGDRWECRRPKHAGGACTEGPRPDGTCCNVQPPCTPRRTLRSMRGMVSKIAALLLLLALIIGIHPGTKSFVNPTAIDAGNLSSVHAGFTRQDGCASCHGNHLNQAGGWLLSAFGSADTSAQCVDCHRFDGPAMKAHNQDHAKNEKYAGQAMADVSCAVCHNEHKGSENKLSKVSDQACASCHKPEFGNFQRGHPEFSAKFAAASPGNIYFDHTSHIQDYFVNPKHMKMGRDPKFAALAKSDCSSCHAIDKATREIKLKSYEQVCANCHKTQIKERELILFEPERMTAAGSVLTGLSRDGDEEINSKALKNLWQSMAASGRSALSRFGAEDLFAGMSDGVARTAGSAWMRGSDLPPADPPESGWFAGENSEGNPALFYRAAKHDDPVLQAWFKKLRAGLADKDDEKRALAREAMNDFLDKQTGPGACGKCHAAGLRSAAKTSNGQEWKYAAHDVNAKDQLKPYSHPKHLNVRDAGLGCAACHQMSADSKYGKYFTPKQVPVESYESNFAAIRKETCVDCHREGQVVSTCQTCHSYHTKHELNVGSSNKELAKK